jgi:SPP1 family predicted phage head-tail adaptor
MATLFVDPGRLSTELALEQAALEPDGAGGHSEVWSEVSLVFGLVEPVSAASTFGAGQTLETVTHRVTIRYRPDVRSGMRFRRQARIFAILTVHDPDESGRYLVCRAREEGR